MPDKAPVCPWCDTPKDGVSINGIRILENYGNQYGTKQKANFCPLCGRPLTEEAAMKRYEPMQAVLGEIEKVKRELKALEADYERESAMRRHIARMHGEEIAKVGNLQNSLDAVRSDRDALNAELVQARREIKALLKIIDESMCDDEKCKICTHYQPNNADADCALMHYLDDGNTLDGQCKSEWRGPCAENVGVPCETTAST